MDAEDARNSWEESADAWDEFVESGLDFSRTELHGPALLAECEPVEGRDVLDLGCGQGWFSRQLAARGARVVGIDWSEKLIGHARRHEAAAPRDITYEVLDAVEVGRRFAPASFDRVTACMSLGDMPDPGAALAASRGLLRPGGDLVVSVSNPVTDSAYRAWERDASGAKLSLRIDRYFEAEPSVLDWDMKRLARPFRTVQYRHTLEQWSRMFEAAGLIIDRMREPYPSPEALARTPELEDATRVPFFLIFVLRARTTAVTSRSGTGRRSRRWTG